MSSTNTLPAIELDTAQQSGEMVPSVEIERIIALRNEGIRQYLEGIQLLRDARKMMQGAGSCQYLYDFERAVEGALRVSESATHNAGAAIARVIDGKIWDSLMSQTGMYTLMSAKQRDEWDKQLSGKDMPAVTLDNVLATFRELNAGKAGTFTQGIIDVFKQLSWDYKTNNPCKFGKRIVISSLLCVRRYGVSFSCESHAKIDDLARPFYVLEGRNVPDYRVSDGARLDEFFSANGFNGEIFEGDYFTVRYFKKGSAHITFKRPELVEQLNDLVASQYPGMLPPRL